MLLRWELQVQTTALTETLRPQGTFPGVRSPSSSSWHQDPALPNSLQTPVLEASGQTTSNTGTQSHPSKKIIIIRREKNMSQMKEQGTNLQDQINEEEKGNLPEKQFRVMIVKTIPNLRNRM